MTYNDLNLNTVDMVTNMGSLCSEGYIIFGLWIWTISKFNCYIKPAIPNNQISKSITNSTYLHLKATKTFSQWLYFMKCRTNPVIATCIKYIGPLKTDSLT